VRRKPAGAFTGEVAAAMLKDVGCSLRDRRTFGTPALVPRGRCDGGAQVCGGAAAGLTPVLCVGETLEEREANKTEAVVARQLDAVIALNGVERFANAVIAYEPVWAIGTGAPRRPEQAQAVHAFIRRRVAAQDARIAGQTRILYGGSVKAGNAAELFSMPDVDGGLVGGASLSADEFYRYARLRPLAIERFLMLRGFILAVHVLLAFMIVGSCCCSGARARRPAPASARARPARYSARAARARCFRS
jgi:triosephosphate isomerase (TIM)